MFFDLADIDNKVVTMTPHLQIRDSLPISGLIIVANQAKLYGVNCKFNNAIVAVFGSAIRAYQSKSQIQLHIELQTQGL